MHRTTQDILASAAAGNSNATVGDLVLVIGILFQMSVRTYGILFVVVSNVLF
jgi:hypothetical protein